MFQQTNVPRDSEYVSANWPVVGEGRKESMQHVRFIDLCAGYETLLKVQEPSERVKAALKNLEGRICAFVEGIVDFRSVLENQSDDHSLSRTEPEPK